MKAERDAAQAQAADALEERRLALGEWDRFQREAAEKAESERVERERVISAAEAAHEAQRPK